MTEPTPTVSAVQQFLMLGADNRLRVLDAKDRDEAERQARSEQGRLATAADVKYYDVAGTWYPYAGAQTFGEYESYREAETQRAAVDELTYVFSALVGNIMTDPETGLTEKARRVADAADDLADRVENPTRDDKAAGGGVLAWLRERIDPSATKDEGGLRFKASDYADVGDPERPDTWQLRLAEKSGELSVRAIADAIAALQPGPRAKTLVSPRTDVTARLREAIDRLPDRKAAGDLETRLIRVKALSEEGPGAFAVFQKDGAWRWFATYSNNYEDREGEAFANDANKEFVGWADADPDGRMPELWYWHVPPGTKATGEPEGMGRADVLDVTTEGFVVAAGTFYDWAVRDGIPQRLKTLGADLGVSHGYYYPREALRDGVYHPVRTYEISPLPMWAAANELTTFHVESAKEATMFSPEKRAAFAAALGDERAGKAEETFAALQTYAREQGRDFKSVVDQFVADMSEVPDPAPAAPAAPEASAPAATEPAPDLSAQLEAAVTKALSPVLDRLEKVEGQTKTLGETWVPRATPAPTTDAAVDAAAKAADANAEPPSGSTPPPGGLDQWYMPGVTPTPAAAPAPAAAP